MKESASKKATEAGDPERGQAKESGSGKLLLVKVEAMRHKSRARSRDPEEKGVVIQGDYRTS